MKEGSFSNSKELKLQLKKQLNDSAALTQFLKFCGIGILNTLVGYGAFFLLINYFYYIFALLISHIIGVIHSYVWNKYWIFKIKKLNVIEFIKFNLIYAVVFIINAFFLYICVDIIKVNPRIAQLFLLPVVTFVSFFGQKLWTFQKNR